MSLVAKKLPDHNRNPTRSPPHEVAVEEVDHGIRIPKNQPRIHLAEAAVDGAVPVSKSQKISWVHSTPIASRHHGKRRTSRLWGSATTTSRNPGKKKVTTADRLVRGVVDEAVADGIPADGIPADGDEVVPVPGNPPNQTVRMKTLGKTLGKTQAKPLGKTLGTRVDRNRVVGDPAATGLSETVVETDLHENPKVDPLRSNVRKGNDPKTNDQRARVALEMKAVPVTRIALKTMTIWTSMVSEATWCHRRMIAMKKFAAAETAATKTARMTTKHVAPVLDGVDDVDGADADAAPKRVVIAKLLMKELPAKEGQAKGTRATLIRWIDRVPLISMTMTKAPKTGIKMTKPPVVDRHGNVNRIAMTKVVANRVIANRATVEEDAGEVAAIRKTVIEETATRKEADVVAADGGRRIEIVTFDPRANRTATIGLANPNTVTPCPLG